MDYIDDLLTKGNVFVNQDEIAVYYNEFISYIARYFNDE